MRYPIALALATVAVTAAPALAKHGHRLAATVISADVRTSPDNEMNPWWRDYQTDLSEARRELASDLRRANDPGDRRDARAEYAREVADARNDYQKEMVERGYPVGSITLTGEPE